MNPRTIKLLLILGTILTTLLGLYLLNGMRQSVAATADNYSGSTNTDMSFIDSSYDGIVLEIARVPFSVDALQSLLYSKGLTGLEVSTMVEIARLESAFNPDAYNPAFGTSGLYQIIGSTWTGYGCGGDVFYWVDNVECAVKVLRGQGWHAWEAYTLKINK